MGAHAENHRVELGDVQLPHHLFVADVGDDRLGHLLTQIVHPLPVDIDDDDGVARLAQLHRQFGPERAEPEHCILISGHTLPEFPV